MMVVLLVIATLAAPILALVVAEMMRERRRRKNSPTPHTEAYEDAGVEHARQMKRDGTFPKPEKKP